MAPHPRYSTGIVYNNYLWPTQLKKRQKEAVETAAQGVLDARALYSDSSLADLYSPLTMPAELTKAHQRLDRAVDLCYRPQAFTTEMDRMEHLFSLYEQMFAPLLAVEKQKLRRR